MAKTILDRVTDGIKDFADIATSPVPELPAAKLAVTDPERLATAGAVGGAAVSVPLLAGGGAAAGAIAGGGSVGSAFLYKFAILNFVTTALAGTASQSVKEEISKVIPLDELRITALNDMYVYAPDENTAQRAYAELESTLSEGISFEQQRLYKERAVRERQNYQSGLAETKASNFRPQMAGETDQQYAAAGLTFRKQQQEEQAVAKATPPVLQNNNLETLLNAQNPSAGVKQLQAETLGKLKTQNPVLPSDAQGQVLPLTKEPPKTETPVPPQPITPAVPSPLDIEELKKKKLKRVPGVS